MTTQAADHTHPVVEFAHRLTARLEEVAAVPVWSMTPAQQRDTLVELARAEAQLAAVRLRVLAEAERVRGGFGAGGGVGGGLGRDRDPADPDQRPRRPQARHRPRTPPDPAPRRSRPVAVNIAQARVIVTALDRLPPVASSRSTHASVQQAEAHLVAWPPTTTRRRWRCWAASCSR